MLFYRNKAKQLDWNLEDQKEKPHTPCSCCDEGLCPQEKAHYLGHICGELPAKWTYRKYFCTSQRKAAAKNSCLTLRG